MSAIPTCEAIISEVHRSFGLNNLQTVQKARFRKLEKDLAGHLKMAEGLIGDLIDALKISSDNRLVHDLVSAIVEFLQFHSAIEAGARTYGADLRQVVWHLLAYQIMPELGRKYAFWSLDGPRAPGLPDGDLWFLPRPVPSDPTRLQLPVQRLAEWWLSLLACPMERIWRDEEADKRVRNFQNWRAGNVPGKATIDEYFGGCHRFEYQDEFSGGPRTVPTNETVRRYFLLARAVQDGYCRLVKLITPDVDHFCSNPDVNKVLQVLQLFEESYKLTLQAEHGAGSPDEGNAHFSTLVPPWLAEGPFKAIMTVQGDEGDVLAGFLTNRFSEMTPEIHIENLFMGGHLTAGPSPQSVNDKARAERIEIEKLIRLARAAIDARDKAKVERRIDQMQSHPRAEEFLADRLLIEARHRLAENEIEQAKALFDQAFDACLATSYGQLRREIAYACLGIIMAFGYFNERAEKYFRIIARSPDLRDNDPKMWGGQPFDVSFRDISARAAERFWTELYRPYLGTMRMSPPDQSALKGFLDDFLNLPENNDEAIERFVRCHQKLLETKLRDVRGDTAFGMLMKCQNTVEKHKLANVPDATFVKLRGQLHSVARKLGAKAFEALDFKKQTTLMLAADAGDVELVRILLEKKIDCDVQDVLGRTALHASAASRAEECYLLILKKGADPTKKTVDGNSALCTAVKFGLVEAVEATLRIWADEFNAEERTTLRELALNIYRDYKKWRRALGEEGRKIGPKLAYEKISQMLSGLNLAQ